MARQMTALRDALIDALDSPEVAAIVEPFESGEIRRMADAILATPAGQRIAAVVEAAATLVSSPEGTEWLPALKALADALDALGDKP
jgi:hypothetical protein